MIRRYLHVVFGGVLAAMLSLASTAQAEPVFVRGAKGDGQGWVFRLGDACWVATAQHVVDGGEVALVIGPEGAQGEAIEIRRLGEALDIALIRLVGSLASKCPASSLGDRDSRPALKAAIGEGRAVAMERRVESGTGDLSGVDIVAMDVIAVPDTRPTFTLRPVQPDRDPIVRSDSGSPIRLRGAGIGESGLPLGLVVSVDGEFVTAVRMDVIRAQAEAMAPARQAPRRASTDLRAMTITHFSGETLSPDCGPLNALRTGAACGWRARKSGQTSAQIALAFSSSRTDLSQVVLTFAPGSAPRGVSVATRAEGQPVDAWSADRYCRLSAGATLICSLGQRTAAGIRLTFDADVVELVRVDVE